MGNPRSSAGAAPSGGRLFSFQTSKMNAIVADALHKRVAEELWQPDPVSRDRALLGYTKKVLDHLVMLEEEVQDLHHRNAQLSRRLRGLQNRVRKSG